MFIDNTNPEDHKKRLLIILYDEQGGNFDHISPPKTPPGEYVDPGRFNFNRMGVRIPAIFVSPLIKPNTILRTSNDQIGFDHCSLIQSLNHRFPLDPSNGLFTERVKNALTFWGILSEDLAHHNQIKRFSDIYDQMRIEMSRVSTAKTEGDHEKPKESFFHKLTHNVAHPFQFISHLKSDVSHEVTQDTKFFSEHMPFSSLATGAFTFGILIKSLEKEEMEELSGMEEEQFVRKLSSYASRLGAPEVALAGEVRDGTEHLHHLFKSFESRAGHDIHEHLGFLHGNMKKKVNYCLIKTQIL